MIIENITVNMMNNLSRSKVSTYMFFHYKTMLAYIFSIGIKRMMRSIYHNISARRFNIFSAFPCRTFFSKKSTLKRFAYFFKDFFRMFMSFLKLCCSRCAFSLFTFTNFISNFLGVFISIHKGRMSFKRFTDFVLLFLRHSLAFFHNTIIPRLPTLSRSY